MKVYVLLFDESQPYDPGNNGCLDVYARKEDAMAEAARLKESTKYASFWVEEYDVIQ